MRNCARRSSQLRIAILGFLLMPFLAGLILTGIHAYLGVHVVERGVIFVAIGAIVSAAGILASFQLDLPTGATIVCTFGVALVILAIVRLLTRSKEDAIAA